MQFKTLFASLIATVALVHAQEDLCPDQIKCVDALETFRHTGQMSDVLIDGTNGKVTRCLGCYFGNLGSCANTQSELKECIEPNFWECIEN